MRKIAVLVLTLALLCSLLQFYVSAQLPDTVTISDDGSITGTDRLQRNGNTYTFTGDILHTLRVEKGNIVIDGAGYTLRGDRTEDPPEAIFFLSGVSGVTIKNLNVKGFGSAISLTTSSNTITKCTIDCQSGIWLRGGSGNHITDNVFYNAKPAVGFGFSSDNQLRNNRMVNSTFSVTFDVDLSNDVDTSNTIDGKPIYYLISQKDLVISRESHPQIGYLALQNCFNVTVKDLWLDGVPNSGIILKNTANSTIAHNHLTDLWAGIYLHNSYSNTVNDNYIANSTHGIVITSEKANTITNNTIESNEVGISLLGSAQVIYRNNLVNNTQQVHSTDWHQYNSKPLPNGVHVWDSAGQGNYWSDHAATDSNHDGVANRIYVIDQVRGNVDHYPLTAPVELPAFVEPPQPSTQAPVDPPSGGYANFTLLIIVVAVIGVSTALVIFTMTRKGKSKI
jgi:parallel beta-helix repeat protein